MLALIHASQLVTLAGPKRARVGAELSELSIISDGGMLIDEGKIVAVGKSSEIEKTNLRQDEVMEATGKIVLPGFVDAHTHSVLAVTVSMNSNSDQRERLTKRSRPAAAESVRLCARHAQRAKTTCYNRH